MIVIKDEYKHNDHHFNEMDLIVLEIDFKNNIGIINF